MLSYVNGLPKTGSVGATFGSYGWSPAPIDELGKMLETMGVQVVAPAVKSLFVPDETVLKNCRELGLTVSKEVAKKLQ